MWLFRGIHRFVFVIHAISNSRCFYSPYFIFKSSLKLLSLLDKDVNYPSMNPRWQSIGFGILAAVVFKLCNRLYSSIFTVGLEADTLQGSLFDLLEETRGLWGGSGFLLQQHPVQHESEYRAFWPQPLLGIDSRLQRQLLRLTSF